MCRSADKGISWAAQFDRLWRGSEMAELTKADLEKKNLIYGLNLTQIVACTGKEHHWDDAKAADAERWYKHSYGCAT